MAEVWRRCSVCKKDIEIGQVYWVCNVSTCNRKRTGLVFCTTECWDGHLGYVNHRQSWALERRAGEEPEREVRRRSTPEPRRKSPTPSRIVRRGAGEVVRPAAPAAREVDPGLPRDILIVASKLKAYIRARSGMNTSERVLGPLSDQVRRLCDDAIENARAAERKTVLGRDF